jgi:hypothetical protein
MTRLKTKWFSNLIFQNAQNLLAIGLHPSLMLGENKSAMQ